MCKLISHPNCRNDAAPCGGPNSAKKIKGKEKEKETKTSSNTPTKEKEREKEKPKEPEIEVELGAPAFSSPSQSVFGEPTTTAQPPPSTSNSTPATEPVATVSVNSQPERAPEKSLTASRRARQEPPKEKPKKQVQLDEKKIVAFFEKYCGNFISVFFSQSFIFW